MNVKTPKREPSDDDILNLEGAAAMLGISPPLVRRLAKAGTLPGHKVGRQWRFSRSNLRSWNAVGGEAQSVENVLSNVQYKTK